MSLTDNIRGKTHTGLFQDALAIGFVLGVLFMGTLWIIFGVILK